MEIENIFAARRSVYALGNEQLMPKDDITSLLEHVLKYAPSAFNSQSSRMVILYGDAYHKFWNITMKMLHKITPPEKLDSMIVKINSFQKGLGTVLFFEDENTIHSLEKQYPLYAENFPKWSQQSSGMLQYMVWIALSAHSIGASLQHYNPLIDDEIHHEYDIPDNWQLIAQMPFGSIAAPAADKTFIPINQRLKIFD